LTSKRKRGDDGEAPLDFSELIRKCGEKAYNFAYRLAGNESDARDLTQEAFVRAYAHLGSYDRSRPFETWLFRILQNIYLDGVRRYAHGHTVSLDAPAPVEDASWEEIIPAGDPDPGHELLKEESERLVQAALDSLPVHYKTAVVLCDREGLSYEEIGEVMACPVGTVRSRIHHGRQLVKKALEALERKGGRLQ
jgi:RNA polymerase sigma-70 factor (ECF subfamily)